MTDFTDLQRAGRSPTGTAWITNPLRRGLLAVARPYFTRILASIAELERTNALQQTTQALAAHQELGTSERLHQRTSALEQGVHDLTMRQELTATLKDELLSLSRTLDALRKDQMAVNHRLGSIEDQSELLQLAPTLDTLRQEQLAVRQRVDGIEANAGVGQTHALVSGIVTLPHNLPMAVLGTSLVLHDGPYGRFLLRQPDFISDHILSGAFWDSHLKPVIERAGAAGGTAIDAGAYLGFHTAYMARYFHTVYAFEPQIEIYRMLCANLLLNNCRNVIATNAALYDVAGHMSLAGSAEQEIPMPGQNGDVDYNWIGNAAALAFRLVDAPDSSAVPAQTVDQMGLTDLGFMKVDTQGSDLHVLRGARATIQRCRPVIAAEFERELAKVHGNTLDDYHGFFDELGYAVEVLDTRGDGKQVDLLATPH